MPDGSMLAEISAAPLHYQDAQGTWQPIDNTLVHSSESGYAYENKANAFTAQFPADLSSGSIRVKVGDDWVSFALDGTSARAEVSGTTITYANVARGVDLQYSVLADSLKESLIIRSPAAIAAAMSLRFKIGSSPGLDASTTEGGGVDFLNHSGGREFSFRPPFMEDASSTESGFSTAVSFALETEPSGLALSLRPDLDWLGDPARRWPVVIDPTVDPSPQPLGEDCQMTEGTYANQNQCDFAKTRVGLASDGYNRRTLVSFDLSSIPQTSQVRSAKLGLYLISQSTAVSAEYRLHRVTKPWTSQATWNKYNGSTAWGNPGGDFDSTVAAATTIPGSAGTGFKYWYPTSLVQDWVDGTVPNYGMLLKLRTESTSNLLQFDSKEGTDPSHIPLLEVSFREGTGELKYYKFESQNLNDRMQVKGNVATGNLLLHASELGINGTAGHSLSVERFYNSLSTESGAFGPGWVMNVGQDVKLEEQSNGDVVYLGPSGFRVRFEKIIGTTGYDTPPGIDATLKKETDGTWTLESFSKDKMKFSSTGRLASQEDKNNNTISFAYSADGTLATITDTHNRTATFTYDASKRISRMVDNAGGRTYSYVYGANGLLADYYDPDNVPTNSGARSTHFDYDANGLLTQVTDPLGNVTKVSYEAGKRKVASITRVTDKTAMTGPTTKFTYDNSADKTTVEDPRRNSTTYTWEEKGRVTEVKDAKGNKRSTSYNTRSNVATYAEAGGITTPFSFGYDSTGNDVTKVTLPTAGFSTINYNENGAPGHFPTSIFDFQNRATSDPTKTGYDRNKASYIYDYDDKGNLLSAKDGLGNKHTYRYNSNGTLLEIKDARTNAGQISDGITTFAYFPSGDLQTINPPSPLGATRFTYDAVSRVKTVTDGAGRTATFTYDPLDRVMEIVYSDGGFVVYDHDLNGNLTSRRDDSSGTINFTYDALNRLTMETPPPPRGANKYEYDAAGNLTSISEQGSTPHLVTTYTYDSVNMVTSVTDPNGAKTNFSYDDPRDTFRTKTIYPNGVTMSVTPDGSTRIKEIKATNAAGQVLTKFTYSYNDGSGDTMLRHSVTDKAGVKTTYTYDPVNRLKTANLANTSGVDFSYAYDPNSNLTSKTVLGATTTLSYNAANQLTRAGSTTYSYDGAGNLTSSLAGFSASYNAKNQTVSMTPPGGEAIPMTYQDASQDKRISASLTDFEYTVLGLSTQSDKGLSSGNNTFVDPNNVQQLSLEKVDEAVEDLSLIVFGEAQSGEATNTDGSSTEVADGPAETDATGVQTDSATEDSGTSSTQDQPTDAATGSVKKSTFWTKDNLGTLVSQRAASGTHYYLFDGLGSVVGLTDSSGRLVNTYKYDPYGKQTNAEQPVDNPWRFASGYTDPPTGFMKFGTRYYDPTVMRWTQVDPVAGNVDDPVSLNPYLYAGNNPANSVDPSGRAHDAVSRGLMQCAALGRRSPAALYCTGANIIYHGLYYWQRAVPPGCAAGTGQFQPCAPDFELYCSPRNHYAYEPNPCARGGG